MRGRRRLRQWFYTILAVAVVAVLLVYARAMIGVGAAAPPPPQAAIPPSAIAVDRIVVDSKQALRSALGATKGGVTILLAPGNYGSVNLVGDGTTFRFRRPVTLRSQDPCAPASFELLRMVRVSNLRLADLHFENPRFMRQPVSEILGSRGGIRYMELLRTDNSDNLVIENNTFLGATIALPAGNPLNGYSHGFGWKGLNLDQVTVRGNRFTNVAKAISIERVKGVRIESNLMTDYRSDGIFMRGADDFRIAGNIMRNVRPHLVGRGEGDHPDFMQINLLANGTIENNYLSLGDGPGMSQGIFVGTAKQVKVRNNVVVTRAVNGISFAQLSDSQITNNLLLKADTPASGLDQRSRRANLPQINVRPNSTNVVIRDNAASAYSRNLTGLAGHGGIVADNNVVLQNVDPGRSNFYFYAVGGMPAPANAGSLTRIGEVLFGRAGSPRAGPDPAAFEFLSRPLPGEPGQCRQRSAPG